MPTHSASARPAMRLVPLHNADLDEAQLDSALTDGALLDGALLDGALLDEALLDATLLDAALLDEALLEDALVTDAQSADNAADQPGWSMAPLDGRSAGLEARGSWLLEAQTNTGMLLYPRDWTFVERREVLDHLRGRGWTAVPPNRFLHITSDGSTVIRLLSSRVDAAGSAAAESPAGAQPAGEVIAVDFRRDDARFEALR